MIHRFKSNGKLLLSGEYAVLKGAKALAIPLKYNQWMDVCNLTGEKYPVIKWLAKDRGKIWFEAVFDKNNFTIKFSSDNHIARNLKRILSEVKKLNNDFFYNHHSFKIVTNTDFPIEWGLGSSSTLLANILKWARLQPFELFFKISNGSGYDVACSLSNSPITYQLKDSKPVINEVSFFPCFHEYLYFVYLGKKQVTINSVRDFFKSGPTMQKKIIDRIGYLTDLMLQELNLDQFEEILIEHEAIIGELLTKVPIKQNLFPDYPGELKSLGAWGGDFMLATWKGTYSDLLSYFRSKGLGVVIPFSEMIL